MGGGEHSPEELASSTSSGALPLRIITHNIRYAATDLFKHEKLWPERLPGILSQLHHYASLPFSPESTIICLQEVLDRQLKDLQASLNARSGNDADVAGDIPWHHVGVGRDDGKAAGEFNPIFYRPIFWQKKHFETIWLSETPDRVSRGWDSGCNRICTCLILQERAGSGRKVMIMNTHLDNASWTARHNAAKLILQYRKKWSEKFGPDHVVLTGDLNSTQDEKDGAWQIFNAEGSGFVDSKRLLRTDEGDVRRFGDSMTFTGFDGKGDADEVTVLDFVHYGLRNYETLDEARDKLRSYAVIPNLFEDGIRCSDHRAVVVDFLL